MLDLSGWEGILGCAVLERLATYGFRLSGWNRSRRHMDGAESFAGTDQLQRFVEGCNVLVCLLPLTSATNGRAHIRPVGAGQARGGIARLGSSRQPRLEDAAPLHDPAFDFNDDVLSVGAALLATLAERRLGI